MVGFEARAGPWRRHSHCKRCCPKQREKEKYSAFSPSSCPLVNHLCLYWPNLTRSQWARQPEICGLPRSAPCDTEVNRKGQGMVLRTNRPMTGTRPPLHVTLMYLPSYFHHSLLLLSQSCQVISRLCCAHAHSLALCSNHPLSLFPLKSYSSFKY